MGRFIRDSAIFFAGPGWNHPPCIDFIRESVLIVQQLPECTCAKLGIKYEEYMIRSPLRRRGKHRNCQTGQRDTKASGRDPGKI
jgi:hypothetical protein